jgi:conjugative transfer pilus assembly protein TraH
MTKQRVGGFRKSVIAVVAASIVMAPAQAGFMEDFFSSAGSAANISPGRVVETQSGTYITGGSAVWRTPQRSFTPFSWQAPSLKAGCGGVDWFGGSFGFASSTEFVNYLRNIGQNSVGLFFKIALESMSPQLSKTMQEISDEIQRMNNHLGNSCQMAKDTLNATGAEQWARSMGNSLSGAMVSLGQASGFYDSFTELRGSVGKVVAAANNLPTAQKSNSGGAPVGNPERNITWLAMNSGSLSNFSAEHRKLAMNMVGTVIYRKNAAQDAVPEEIVIGALSNAVQVLAGRWNDANVPIGGAWDCGNDPTSACLTPTVSTWSLKPLAAQAYESLRLVRDAIRDRQAVLSLPNGSAALQILGTTRLPVYRVLELTSAPSMAGVSDALLEKYADYMGLEMAARMLTGLLTDVQKSLSSSQGTFDGLARQDLEQLNQTLLRQLRDIRSAEETLVQLIGPERDLVTQVEHLERSLYASFNLRVADNLRFARR